MKKAYVTILSSDNFVKGVEATYAGVRKFSNEVFLIIVSKEVSSNVKNQLSKLGANIIEEDFPSIKDGILSRKQIEERWGKTIFKLVIFKNHGYDKLVYLDSDLLIRNNIDELFEKPAFSAVADKDFFPAYARGGLNSGVMVIAPDEALYEDLVKTVESVAVKYEVFGDQDVINDYLVSWGELNELHLDVSYNTCFYDSERVRDPKVVHFILADKPWMWSTCAVLLKKIKWILQGKHKQVEYLKEYLRML